MLVTIMWVYQGRACYLYTASAIDAEMAAGAISERFQCKVGVWQGAKQIMSYSNGKQE